jgi:hypothetical protein
MMARMGASSASNWYSGWLQATATSDQDFACKARIKGFDRKQQPALVENTLTNAGQDHALALGFPTPDHVQVGWFVTKLGHEWILDEKMFKKEWKKLQLNAEATRRFEDAVDRARHAVVDDDQAMKLARERAAGENTEDITVEVPQKDMGDLKELRLNKVRDSLHYSHDAQALVTLLDALSVEPNKFSTLKPIADKPHGEHENYDGWIERDDFVQWYTQLNNVDFIKQPARKWMEGRAKARESAGKVLVALQQHGDPSVVEWKLSAGGCLARTLGSFFNSDGGDTITPPLYNSHTHTVRIPRFAFPKIIGSLVEQLVGAMESAFRFVLQLLASSVVFWPFMYREDESTVLNVENGELVKVYEYVRLQGHHDHSSVCDEHSVLPWDKMLAFGTTAVFFVLLPPYLHMLLRCFAPGLPRITKVCKSRARLSEPNVSASTKGQPHVPTLRDAPLGRGARARLCAQQTERGEAT